MRNLIVVNKTSREISIISNKDYNSSVLILGSIKEKGVLTKFYSMSTECNDFCKGSVEDIIETLKEEVVCFIDFDSDVEGNKTNYIEITNREEFEDNKNDYTHILQVDGDCGYNLYLLHTSTWSESANEIAKENGFERHDHDSEKFIGCPFNDEDCVNILLNDL